MDAGLDTGPILLAEALPIAADDTAATLQDRLAVLGGRLIVEALGRLPSLVPRPQPEAGASYAAKIDKAEGALDWRLAAVQLERRVRAFDPFPGCHFEFGGEVVKLWSARVVEGQGEPGRVLHAADGRLVVACGAGALELLTLQRSGGRRITAREFLHAHPVSGPTVFGPARA
jgi:methionyl-tRNA formyltransferase